jgi:hypothetical protein
MTYRTVPMPFAPIPFGAIPEKELRKADVGMGVSIAIAGGIVAVALMTAYIVSGEAFGAEGIDITDVD